MITLASPAQAAFALDRARNVLFAAYTLAPGRMLRSLADAARRGARVTVRLEGCPHAPALQRNNERAAAMLRAAGADVGFADADGHGAMLHAKALVCDGIAYLNDRNWPASRDQVVVRDSNAADVRALRDALKHGHPRSTKTLTTTKSQGERAEANMLRGVRGGAVDVQSETFGTSAQVYASLKSLAARGVRCRLLVAGDAIDEREQHALDALRREGVSVRTAAANEKFAIAGTRVWMGSANATATAKRDALDWGVETRSRAAGRALRAQFDRQWDNATPYAATG